MTAGTSSAPGEAPEPGNVQRLDLEANADQLLAKLSGDDRQVLSLARKGNVSVVMMAFASGSTLKAHSAEGVVIIQVLRGRVNITAAGDLLALGAGELVMLQSGVRHDVRAAERSVILLTISAKSAGQ